MNIVLIGYRCSGKTAVSKILAKELRRNFVDTDALIEEYAGCSVEAMISRTGWRHFRKIEKTLMLLKKIYPDCHIKDTSKFDGRDKLSDSDIIDCYKNVYLGIEKYFPAPLSKKVIFF